MIAILLIIPLTIIRYWVPSLIDKSAVQRASFFPPVEGREKLVLNSYKILTIALLVTLFFYTASLARWYNYIGLGLYLLGMVLYILAIVDFAKAKADEAIRQGLYKYSRNPMYVAFFLNFLGITLLIGSWLYLTLLLAFQTSVHYIILGEEKWCQQEYGQKYRDYLSSVRRYL